MMTKIKTKSTETTVVPTIRVPSREVRSWKAHPGGDEGAICAGGCLAFTPDVQLLASGSWDRTLKLWQVSTGQLLKTLTGHIKGGGICRHQSRRAVGFRGCGWGD